MTTTTTMMGTITELSAQESEEKGSDSFLCSGG